jgi:hypothetical protein
MSDALARRATLILRSGLGRVSKDEARTGASWFETLFRAPHHEE